MSQRQFLPVDEDSMDTDREFNLNEMTAMDYLKQVRFERRTIPQVVTVHPMVSEPEVPTKEVRKIASDCSNKIIFQLPIQDSKKLKDFNPNDPTKEWREIQKEKFKEMQNKIVEIRKDPTIETRLSEIDIDSEDEESCLVFFKQNEPVLSIVLIFNQGVLEELIEILSSHLEENISTLEAETVPSLAWTTKWIYALLACLRSPLDPAVHSCIRTIAKSCIRIIEHLKTLPKTTSEAFLAWNLIVVVIGLNFKQFDLLSL